ncbi:ATP-binding protein [Rhizobium helianthi]|uniref:ATP-binding protein n=1 Tax=Rhizobium helianthi TaxID=1132695 RepID=A0ABW4M4C5_9HYPH
MIQDLVSTLSAGTNPLSALLDEQSGASLVGYTIHTSYDAVTVMTNDKWREDAGGIPMNSYLLACSADPSEMVKANPIDKRILLLRVVGRAELATDRDMVRAVMEHFQDKPDTRDPAFRMEEPISFSMLQWSGIECKVLGTFFTNGSSALTFGADAEDFFAARHMVVRKPGSAALSTIVNFVDPIRKAKADKDAIAIGMKRAPSPFEIGTVRFTSSNQLALRPGQSQVPVKIFPGDFLARRTAVFGMTRTGKSNTTKTMVSAVALSAFESDTPIGQIILDINGEYSNANNQDGGSSIADVFADNTVRYRIGAKSGFRDVRVNFFENLEVGHQFIAEGVTADGSNLSEDLKSFVACDFTRPDQSDYGSYGRWKRKVAIYRSFLANSGFKTKPNYKIEFEINEAVLSFLYPHVIAEADRDAKATLPQKARAVVEFFELEPMNKGFKAEPSVAVRFWLKVREVEKLLESTGGIKKGKDTWLGPEDHALLAMLAGRSHKSDTPIRAGNYVRASASEFHSPDGSNDIVSEIYDLLSSGRIVIVDLSVGVPKIRETMAERIAKGIFTASSAKFTSGQSAPRIVLYVEEAHNLIGKKADLNTTWPRVAKEGAKYGMAMVYATQEPSSIHPNILSNTENFFVTHLNNDDEIRTLSKYYDFGDFAPSLKRCQDVGFARIKTLSANFTTPTQIMLFDPARVGEEYRRAKSSSSSWFSPLNEGV